MAREERELMGVEVLSTQNAGGGSSIKGLPETTFDDNERLRRLPGGSIVGEAYLGYGAVLRLVPLEYGPGDETSHLRAMDALGFLSLADYRESADLGDLN